MKTSLYQLTNVVVYRKGNKIAIEYEHRINGKKSDGKFLCSESLLVQHLESSGILGDAQFDSVPTWGGIEPEFEDVLVRPETTFSDFLTMKMANDCKAQMHEFLKQHDRNYPH